MIFFVLSILSYLVQDFSNKGYCLRVKKSSFGSSLVQNAICCFCSFFALLLTGSVGALPLSLLPLAVLFGISFLSTVFLLLCAFMHGTVGLSTLICNIGSFVAAFYGVVRFGDRFTVFIACGYVCMLAAVILCTPRTDRGEKGGMTWFLLALGSGISNGVVASVKREAVALAADDIQSFLAFGFLFAGVFASVFVLVSRQNRALACEVLRAPKTVLCGVLAGAGGALANLFQMLSLKSVPSTVVYPLTAGLLVVILWLASVFVYRESRCKMRNVIAVVCCLLAILFSNLP